MKKYVNAKLFIHDLKEEKIKPVQVESHGDYHFEIYPCTLSVSVAEIKSDKKIFFQNKEQTVSLTGFGSVTVEDPIFNKTPVFLAKSFQGNDLENEWEGFGQDFWTPIFSMVKTENESYSVFAAHKSLARNEQIEQLEQILQPRYKEIPPLFPQFKKVPTRDIWNHNIRSVLADIKDKTLSKVVLARKLIKCFSLKVAPETQYKIEGQSFNTFWQVAPFVGFISHTPERLFKISDNKLIIDVLAGTAPRGETPRDDELLKQSLLNSKKDLNEHRLVAQDIEQRLSQLGLKVRHTLSESILSLKHVHHIHGIIEAELPSDFEITKNIHTLIELLHPTPAMGGVPRGKALEKISELESFERGLYAAPFGYFLGNKADFCVGIRSILIRENEIHLFGGAGIVEGSTPEFEWLETGRKMWQFLDEEQREWSR